VQHTGTGGDVGQLRPKVCIGAGLKLDIDVLTELLHACTCVRVRVRNCGGPFCTLVESRGMVGEM
jgi:hypothetical protein